MLVAKPPGEQKIIDLEKTSANDEADNARKRLTDVLLRFADPDTGYASRERPMFMRRNPGD